MKKTEVHGHVAIKEALGMLPGVTEFALRLRIRRAIAEGSLAVVHAGPLRTVFIPLPVIESWRKDPPHIGPAETLPSGYVPSGMNVDRASWAQGAIDEFQSLTNTDDSIVDLLCDLMHYAAQNSQDFDRELARAREHFDVERAGEE